MNAFLQEALDRMLRLLTRFHNCFVKHSLDPEVISLIFKQLYFYICAGSLNNLLLRKELCHWSKGMQVWATNTSIFCRFFCA